MDVGGPLEGLVEVCVRGDEGAFDAVEDVEYLACEGSRTRNRTLDLRNHVALHVGADGNWVSLLLRP